MRSADDMREKGGAEGEVEGGKGAAEGSRLQKKLCETGGCGRDGFRCFWLCGGFLDEALLLQPPPLPLLLLPPPPPPPHHHVGLREIENLRDPCSAVASIPNFSTNVEQSLAN
jgi:hypothetical protein